MPQIAFILEKLITDEEGRYVMVIGKVEDVMVLFMNVYNPPEEGPDLIKKVVKMIVSESQGIVVMAAKQPGDATFNGGTLSSDLNFGPPQRRE